jgi:hypothetical protein
MESFFKEKNKKLKKQTLILAQKKKTKKKIHSFNLATHGGQNQEPSGVLDSCGVKQYRW